MKRLEEKSLEEEPLKNSEFIEDAIYIAGSIAVVVVAGIKGHLQVYEPIKEYLFSLF